MDHPIYLYHYKVAISTGLAPDMAKLYANHQFINPIDINHLKAIPCQRKQK